MSDALMRKTKQQLVNIILRKDDIHKSLNDDILKLTSSLEDKDKLYNNLREQVKQLNKKIVDLNDVIKSRNTYILNLEDLNKNLDKDRDNAILKANDLAEACDEYASRIQEYINTTKHYKCLSALTSSIAIIVLITMLIVL
jgi:chromosome segregation ATPase